MKQALSKLHKDISEISALETNFQQILPILLVNIQDDSFISELQSEIKDEDLREIPILNISNFKKSILN
ncbi:hypothetical protein [Marinifilum flexuosum]|uniref:hypothetical protein n=1 Tax=Marinifilum flexuosum TaxID=1117708 RepID=UPI0024948E2D|nr:hypothetical protein [Marinifilum flexuosum]